MDIEEFDIDQENISVITIDRSILTTDDPSLGITFSVNEIIIE